MKNSDSYFNCLSIIPLSFIFFELLFQLAHGFLLLSSCWNSFESNALPWWIDSEALRSKLFIASYQSYINTKWSHPGILWLFLQIISSSLGKHMNWNLILVFEFIFSCLRSHVCDEISCIIHVSYKNDSTVITDPKNVSDWIRDNKFVRHFLLAAYYYAIFSSYCNWCLPKLMNSFECIFHLVNSAICRKYFHHFFHWCHSFYNFNFR